MTIHHFDGIDAVYATGESGSTAFTIVPSSMAEKMKEKRLLNLGTPYGHVRPEPMVQVALSGDSPSRDFSAGISLRNTETALSLRMERQETEETADYKEVRTYLFSESAHIRAVHYLRQNKGCVALECKTEIINAGEEDKYLEYLASFSVSCISPFWEENDPDTIYLHRIRNNWSGEGRLDSLPVSRFAMEDSTSCFGYRMERFGQAGNMPARGFLPFVAIEDKAANVTWAASMEAPESWLIEAGHHNCSLHMSGGISDFNWGHWRKLLKGGERFVTRTAYLTVEKGDLQSACNDLTLARLPHVRFAACEEDLPLVYNDFLYSDSKPTLENVIKQLPFLRECGVKYFVVDDGWYYDSDKKRCFLGDWTVNEERFPGGLKAFSDKVREYGMTAGIWYEFENVTKGAPVSQKSELFHTRDGKLIRHEDRMFLDFRKPETLEFLRENVIARMKNSGIGYVKIDYNENIGLGADGAESYGEALRGHMEKVIEFYREIRREIPDIVIEVCSSGGMRHEPLFLTLGDMQSFSDLCEHPSGAVAACDLHRFLLPRQMQVWAVIRAHYSDERIRYTLAQGMLGRMCLSGDLEELSDAQKELVKEGCRFYEKIKFMLKEGITKKIDTAGVTSLRFPHAAFSLTRISKDGAYALLYAFRLNGKEKSVDFDLPDCYAVEDMFGSGKVERAKNKLSVIPADTDTFGTVVLAKKIQ